MSSARTDGLARREALLDAALRCFAARGVAGTGIEHIRREAGASPSSVYHQFAGIEELMLALLIRTFTRLFGHLTAEVGRTRRAHTAVERLVASHIDWVMANPDEARFMYQAMSLELGSQVTAELQAEKARLLAPIARHLQPFIEAGELPAWPPLLFDVVLMGATHEACRRYLAGAPLDTGWMRATLPRLAWNSLVGLS
ncbi:MAG: TetR/AcrR family transcriptional regulator [Polyangiaceae bacterium]